MEKHLNTKMLKNILIDGINYLGNQEIKINDNVAFQLVMNKTPWKILKVINITNDNGLIVQLKDGDFIIHTTIDKTFTCLKLIACEYPQKIEGLYQFKFDEVEIKFKKVHSLAFDEAIKQSKLNGISILDLIPMYIKGYEANKGLHQYKLIDEIDDILEPFILENGDLYCHNTPFLIKKLKEANKGFYTEEDMVKYSNWITNWCYDNKYRKLIDGVKPYGIGEFISDKDMFQKFIKSLHKNKEIESVIIATEEINEKGSDGKYFPSTQPVLDKDGLLVITEVNYY